MIASVLVIAGIAAVVGYNIYSYRRLKSQFGEALVAYNAGAFIELVELHPDERVTYVTRLAPEIESKKGVKAVSMAPIGGGLAIHHINKNGTFSKKGPYFVRWGHPSNWRSTGSTHLVKVIRGKGGNGFPPDHYKQTGIIREKGVAILEYGTKRYRALSLREFADRQKALQRSRRP